MISNEEQIERDRLLNLITEAFLRLKPAIQSITDGINSINATLGEIVDHEIEEEAQEEDI
jgi:hypothetical protein